VSELLSQGKQKIEDDDWYSIVGHEVQDRWIECLIDLFGPAEAVDDPYVLDLGDGLRVQAHPDVVFRDSVWEIKSVGPDRYMFVRIRPFQVHVEQLQAYLHATGKPKGYLLYESRGGGEIKVYQVNPDPGVLERLKTLLTSGAVSASVEEVGSEQTGRAEDQA